MPELILIMTYILKLIFGKWSKASSSYAALVSTLSRESTGVSINVRGGKRKITVFWHFRTPAFLVASLNVHKLSDSFSCIPHYPSQHMEHHIHTLLRIPL